MKNKLEQYIELTICIGNFGTMSDGEPSPAEGGDAEYRQDHGNKTAPDWDGWHSCCCIVTELCVFRIICFYIHTWTRVVANFKAID